MQDLQDTKVLKAVKVNTVLNLADMFTKCLSSTVRTALFKELRSKANEVLEESI